MNHLSHFFSETSHKILLLSLTIFTILRFPSLFEPYWYGDEGIYQAIGKALRLGIPLYDGVWDNKPPLLYVLYAIADGDQFTVRLLSLIVGIISVALFFKLSSLLVKNTSVVYVLTILFAVLFASPYLEGNIANAENFMLLPAFLGFLLILQHTLKKDKSWISNSSVSLLIGGFLLGISFMIKIVGVFDFLTISFFLFLTYSSIQKTLRNQIVITLGFLLPFLVISLYFLSNGLLSSYLTATFFSNVTYVGYENFFLIPQGLLILKLILLFGFLAVLFFKRKKIQRESLFIITWFGFSLFSSFFSHRSYTHYLLLSLPSLILVGGLVYEHARKKLFFSLAYVFLVIFLIVHFKPFPVFKSVAYYGNFISYLFGQTDEYKYQLFFDPDVPRDYQIAEYLNMKLSENEEVFIYGNSAQIYVLSDTIPISRYTVAYHINNESAVAEVQKAINSKHPKYVVILPDQRLGSIYLPNYVYRLNLEDTAIYEYIN